jgi:hypothetical protein
MEKIEPDGEVVAEFSGTTLFPWIAWSPLGPLLFRAWYQVTVAEATVDVHRVWGGRRRWSSDFRAFRST